LSLRWAVEKEKEEMGVEVDDDGPPMVTRSRSCRKDAPGTRRELEEVAWLAFV